ncbi:hypothetical protein GGF31_003291 [Allomyces arbusculus]|nr:hypothetical protein GGF31_003291 [Allomyces arbusculus]
MTATPRKFFVGGNWKMNGSTKSIQTLVDTLNKAHLPVEQVDVVVAPPAPYLALVRSTLDSKLAVSAQNVYAAKSGAFTGETSPLFLKDLDIHWTLTGHSERRQYFRESSEYVAEKTKFALDQGLSVIACIGESLIERETGATNAVLASQLEPLAAALTAADWARVVLAYEPVWAIGTGKVATPAQAQDAHKYIRSWLAKHVSPAVAQATRVIYGGSVTAGNCGELARMGDIDGFLVGGASLKPEFTQIVKAQL